MDDEERFQDAVRNVSADLFLAERAYFILRGIGQRAGDLKAGGLASFDMLFGAFQQMCADEVLLCTARLYDPPNKKHETLSLRSVLQTLECRAEKTLVVERLSLQRHLDHIGDRQSAQLLKDYAGDEKVIRSFVGYFGRRLDEPDIAETLLRLKTVRDKELAHSDHAAPIVGPTWAAVERLLDLAKEVITAAGWCHSTAFGLDGRYFATEEAQRYGTAIERLFKRLGGDGESALAMRSKPTPDGS
jgi:hypothetical protein